IGGDRDAPAILVKQDVDVGGMTVHCLVDAVVENFPNEVVEACRSHTSDVHAPTLANRLEPFKDIDIFCGVIGSHQRLLSLVPAYGLSSRAPEFRLVRAPPRSACLVS